MEDNSKQCTKVTNASWEEIQKCWCINCIHYADQEQTCTHKETMKTNRGDNMTTYIEQNFTIKDANKKTQLHIEDWIGTELVFNEIVNIKYNEGEPHGMDPNKTYLFDQDDIEYAISICDGMLHNEYLFEGRPHHKWLTQKVKETLTNIGDQCYVRWNRRHVNIQ